MNSIRCNVVGCDHNTGYTNECMFKVTDELVSSAKSNEHMCGILRLQILKELAHESTITDKEIVDTTSQFLKWMEKERDGCYIGMEYGLIKHSVLEKCIDEFKDIFKGVLRNVTKNSEDNKST